MKRDFVWFDHYQTPGVYNAYCTNITRIHITLDQEGSNYRYTSACFHKDVLKVICKFMNQPHIVDVFIKFYKKRGKIFIIKALVMVTIFHDVF